MRERDTHTETQRDRERAEGERQVRETRSLLPPSLSLPPSSSLSLSLSRARSLSAAFVTNFHSTALQAHHGLSLLSRQPDPSRDLQLQPSRSMGLTTSLMTARTGGHVMLGGMPSRQTPVCGSISQPLQQSLQPLHSMSPPHSLTMTASSRGLGLGGAVGSGSAAAGSGKTAAGTASGGVATWASGDK